MLFVCRTVGRNTARRVLLAFRRHKRMTRRHRHTNTGRHHRVTEGAHAHQTNTSSQNRLVQVATAACRKAETRPTESGVSRHVTALDRGRLTDRRGVKAARRDETVVGHPAGRVARPSRGDVDRPIVEVALLGLVARCAHDAVARPDDARGRRPDDAGVEADRQRGGDVLVARHRLGDAIDDAAPAPETGALGEQSVLSNTSMC